MNELLPTVPVGTRRNALSTYTPQRLILGPDFAEIRSGEGSNVFSGECLVEFLYLVVSLGFLSLSVPLIWTYLAFLAFLRRRL